MASPLEKDLSCPVCQDFFKDPVVLSCSHSFCKFCVQKWWRQKLVKECPVCKRRSLLSDPPHNLALKNLCETFMQERDHKTSAGSEALCSLHSERLKLFCLDHEQPVCLICRDSIIHNKHRFRPIHEAAKDHREELQTSLKPLKEKLKLFEQVKANYDQAAEHIKVQARHTEKKIKKHFKDFHQFLEEEEEARITAVRREEELKSQMMKEKMEALSREIAALSDTVRATEDELRAEDVSFLHNYKAAVQRVQQRPLLDDPQLPSGALIDATKHLGNLNFNIWSNMKDLVSYTPVVLDPNTAHPELALSEDLTSVRHGEKKNVPKNPERFDSFVSVLGSEGFSSGTHSWDVEVGSSPAWAVGVSAKSFQNNSDVPFGLFGIVFCDGEYATASDPDQRTVLQVKKKLHGIRVHLDSDRGTLTFSDPDSDTHIHTHTFKHTFTERLFPYFNTKNRRPLKILHIPVSVSVKQ